ncbi:LpxI family protein [Pseudoprimorskyibacter insulae]|uniref:Uncharacterized protein n=1 Tax=Pseudoprimorskyibacter insulae TaxID=1695997 RepID=A0A2R8AWF7_9RHOB|nr:UDP-2,3-diacylglucosamine diphosphatase LpxI [Pseudoprimorskyibacter insulae]SPF80363.1 hypothetical protein PRI8871_02168 [Pseudoprimorskyibacter insulae]
MLALIAGQGALPSAVAAAAPERPLICALQPYLPDDLSVDRSFRIEQLGGFLHWLRSQGVTQICMCGRVERPRIDLKALDWRTALLVPRIRRAIKRGDDGALRIVIGILEQAGFEVLGAHEIAPSLLPVAGVLTQAGPTDTARADAALADQVLGDQGRADQGQSCVLNGGVIARESDAGTDAMLAGVQGAGTLFKGPKPGQDRRADLPVIGPDTARSIIRAGLDGIAIQAGGVMVLEQAEVIRLLDAAGKFLWVREGTV